MKYVISQNTHHLQILPRYIKNNEGTYANLMISL